MRNTLNNRSSLLVFMLFGVLLVIGSCGKTAQEPSGEQQQTTAESTAAAQTDENQDTQKKTSGDPSTAEQSADTGENNLADASSPYLRMHADNPIHWYKWGEKAFRKAKEEDKPIFLSIGYYTCHWCHVMERKVFMDKELAQKFNDLFVNIKVDREQRPAVDHTYMTAAHRMGRRGGWPLSVFMTPEKKPFFIGTYIPPERISPLLDRLGKLWTNPDQRKKLLKSASKVSEAMQQAATGSATGEGPGKSELHGAYDGLVAQFDEQHAGFGQSQKFPSPHNLIYLLRYWHRTDKEKALSMVTRTLDAMRTGAMYDHVGYGFHRYSTDREWKLPHFEKMLYDQAMLTYAYAEGYQATDKQRYRRTAEQTISFVNRDMGAENGGFYSALASGANGIEGAEYVWSIQEVRDALPEERASLVINTYNMTEEGNYKKEASGERTGKNVLQRTAPISELARDHELSEDAYREALHKAHRTLLAYREENKPQMGVDDKVLTDWNGMMIAALAKSARAFDKQKYADQAKRAAEFVLSELETDDGRLKHRYLDGEVGVTGKATDYAYLTWGLIELYQTTFETKWLKKAIALTDTFVEHYWDRDAGGFYFSPDFEEMPMGRQKQVRDGARPSANSVAMWNLFRLGRITANSSYEEKAKKIGEAFSGRVTQRPASATMMMTAVDLMVGPSYEVVIAGDPEAKDTRRMLRAVWDRYIPRKVVVQRPAGASPEITSIAEYTEPQTPKNERATAYVCMNYACKLPTNSIQKMNELLNAEYAVQPSGPDQN